MSDQGPDGHPYNAKDEDIEVVIDIDLDEISNLDGESLPPEDEGSAKGRHPSARRLLP